MLLFVALAAVGPWLQPADPGFVRLDDRLLPPLRGSVLGTDQLGRDVFARLLDGLVWSLGVAGGATVMALAIGLLVGLLSVAGPGPVVRAVRRFLDLTMSLPTLVIAIALIAIVGQGFWPLVVVLGVVSWPVFARVVEAEGLAVKQRDFVLAARLYNVSEAAILLRHIVPSVWRSVIVICAFHFADMLIAESALSFLGVGAPLGEPTWGNMLAESRQYLHNAPWLMLAPALAIVSVVVSVNLFGDYLIAKVTRSGERGG
ncbi:MAG: ABC transporter permease [Pseudomonadota bacterium]